MTAAQRALPIAQKLELVKQIERDVQVKRGNAQHAEFKLIDHGNERFYVKTSDWSRCFTQEDYNDLERFDLVQDEYRVREEE
jgi:hypothetical protein